MHTQSYSSSQQAGLEQSLQGVLNQIARNANKERKLLICPLSEDIFSYRLCDNLARTASNNGFSVLLWNLSGYKDDRVSANSQQCDLDAVLKAHNVIEAGLSKRPDDTIWETESAVRFRGNPRAIGESKALSDAVRHFSKMFDLVIMNCPPINTLDEGYRSFATYADSIILVARKGKTRKQEIARSVEITRGLPVTGFIMFE